MESHAIRVYLKTDPQFKGESFPALHSLLASLQGAIEVIKFEDSPTKYFFVKFDNSQAVKAAVEYLHNQFFKFGTVKAYSFVTEKSKSFNSSDKPTPPIRKIGGPVILLNYVPNSSVLSGENSRLSKKIELISELKGHPGSRSKIAPPSESKPVKSRRSPNSDDQTYAYENSSRLQNNRHAKYEASPEESCFVHITNLNPKFLNHKVIINLACCFGNALRVYVDQPSGKAVIKYQNSNDAALAKFHLRDQPFLESRLQIIESMPVNIDRVTLAPTDSDLKMYDCKAPDFRYKDTLNVKYNAPSAVLHFTNLSENCTPQILFQIISAIHEPKKIVKLAKKSLNATNMMLVLFKSVTESLEVLTVLHNKIVDHKSLRVSFSHTKLTSRQFCLYFFSRMLNL